MNQKLFDHQYLKHLCQKYGLIPSKKYGQNFLINSEPIEKMVESAGINKDDMVVEVGPGFGVLTLALAEKAKKVLAFEIEKKLELYWGEEIKKHSNVEIVWGNMLREVESQKSLNSLESYKVVANLPYQITSQILRTFLEAENKPEVLVLMVQKEVAERICAKAGDMSVLAVSVQYYGVPETVMQVPRGNFWPAPAVDSAVIRVLLRGRSSLRRATDEAIPGFGSVSDGIAALPLETRNDNEKFFFKVVKAGFSSRRKMLIKNLSAVADKNKIKAIFKELGIDEKVRAQELTVEQWKQISLKVVSYPH